MILADSSRSRKAEQKAKKIGLGGDGHTLLICMDRKTAKCCRRDSMAEAWNHIKRLAKAYRKNGHGKLLRLKTGCIGVCCSGPIIGVMPDNVWYGRCSDEVIERIFKEHLVEGNIVSEYVIAQPSGQH